MHESRDTEIRQRLETGREAEVSRSQCKHRLMAHAHALIQVKV